MSGGHFNYDQYRCDEIADDIDRLIARNNEDDGFGFSNGFSDETLAKFRLAAKTCREAAKMVQRVDWLASGDDREESFHRRWNEEGLPSANGKDMP